MKDTRPSITTSFVISGDNLDPDVCTKVISLTPTEMRVKSKTKRANGTVYRASASWSLDCEKRRIYSIEDVLLELLQMLWLHRTKILAYLGEGVSPAQPHISRLIGL